MEKDKETTNTKDNKIKNIILILIGLFFIISAAMYFDTIPVASILLLLSGIVLIPEINKKIKGLLKENDKVYKYIKIVFIIFSFIYFVGSVPTELSEVNVLKNEIKALNGQIENITSEKNEILKKYENSIKELDKEINNTIQVEELQNTILEKDIRIQELENTLNTSTEKVKELENTVSSNNEKIKSLENNVSTLEKDKSSLEQKINSLSSTKSSTSTESTKITSNAGTTNSYTVYITKTGSKYHRSGCSYLKSKISIDKASAISQGYTACSRCNP